MEKTGKARNNRQRFIDMQGINRFPERLKIAMSEMTNVALANSCGLSESAVRSYLKGKSYPGIDKIEAIAQACDAPMTWLITGTSDALKSDEIVSYSDDGLAAVLDIMSTEQRSILASLIIQHGINGIFSALNGLDSVAEFSRLPEAERQQIMRLHSEVKKGASITGEVSIQNDPAQQKTGSS